LNIEHLLLQISKKTIYGTPTELNYAAMIFAMVARIIERIPTIKDLLKHDFIFRLDCGFLFSDQLPSKLDKNGKISFQACQPIMEGLYRSIQWGSFS
jgi:hypothetical protein